MKDHLLQLFCMWNRITAALNLRCQVWRSIGSLLLPVAARASEFCFEYFWAKYSLTLMTSLMFGKVSSYYSYLANSSRCYWGKLFFSLTSTIFLVCVLSMFCSSLTKTISSLISFSAIYRAYEFSFMQSAHLYLLPLSYNSISYRRAKCRLMFQSVQIPSELDSFFYLPSMRPMMVLQAQVMTRTILDSCSSSSLVSFFSQLLCSPMRGGEVRCSKRFLLFTFLNQESSASRNMMQYSQYSAKVHFLSYLATRKFLICYWCFLHFQASRFLGLVISIQV